MYIHEVLVEVEVGWQRLQDEVFEPLRAFQR